MGEIMLNPLLQSVFRMKIKHIRGNNMQLTKEMEKEIITDFERYIITYYPCKHVFEKYYVSIQNEKIVLIAIIKPNVVIWEEYCLLKAILNCYETYIDTEIEKYQKIPFIYLQNGKPAKTST